MMVRCAFCEGSMSPRPTVDGVEGETGGMWHQQTLECATCGGAVAHDVILKIGSTRESWHIKQMPTQPTRRTTLHCPACDAQLVSAWPPDAQPVPATSFDADRPARAERRSDHRCVGCDARYVLDEEVEVRWFTQGDGAPIASPRTYPRRK